MSPDAFSGRSYTVPGYSTYIARCAQLAMLLEVSSSPKPGNVDRDHDYPDTLFEHFLASAVGAYPALEEAARSRKGIGSLIKKAVLESVSWQKGGNTHFGAFLLLVPLSMAAGELFERKSTIEKTTKESGILSAEELELLVSRAHLFVQATGPQDAVEFYRAFKVGGVRVNGVEEFDLEDPNATAELLQKNVSLYDLMEISKGYDLIANEWTSGFLRCLECARHILEHMEDEQNFQALGSRIRAVVVYTFLLLLSKNRDTFIQTKFGAETADYVLGRAGKILKTGGDSLDFEALLPSIIEFDSELLEKRINPGSTADITIAGLFIALLGGLRF